MKWWIIVLFCWGLTLYMILGASNAAPAPYIDNSKFVTIPVIQTENGQLWEARLQCDRDMQSCVVVYAKEICEVGKTHFSPSFCWEFGR